MHKKIISFIIIALSLILRPSACLGQTSTSASQWMVEKFDVENGLDHKSVRGFVFDKNGLAWLGNEYGLKIFDGKRIYPASDYLGRAAPLIDAPISGIVYDSSLHCLFVLSSQNDSTSLYSVALDMVGTKNNYLTKLLELKGALLEDAIYGQNKIYCVLNQSVHLIVLNKNRLQKVYINRDIPSNIVLNLGDADYYGSDLLRTVYYKIALIKDSLHLEKQGKLEVKNDMNFFTFEKGQTTINNKVYYNKSIITKLQCKPIIEACDLVNEYKGGGKIVKDAWSNYYLFGPKGLQKISQKNNFIKGIEVPRETRALLYNQYKNTVYIGAANGIYPYTLNEHKVGAIFDAKIFNYYNSAQYLNDSTIAYFGLQENKRIVIIDLKKNQALKEEHHSPVPIRSIYPISVSKSSYYGSDSGLYKGGFYQGHFVLQKIATGPKDAIVDIRDLNDSILVLAGTKGLYSYNVRTHKSYTIAKGTFICLEKMGRNLVVGTDKFGALIYDHTLQLQQSINTKNNLKDNTVYSLLADTAYQTLWIGTGNGLSVIHLPTGISKTFTTHDGLLHDELNHTSTYRFQGDSTLIMGGLKGINIIQNRIPFTLPFAEIPVPNAWAIIASYSNQKTQKVFINRHQPILTTFGKDVQKLDIKISSNSTAYLYATAYKLDDKEWAYLNHSQDITLTDLKEGRHQLLIKTVLANGQESKTLKIELEIEHEWGKNILGILFIFFSTILLIIPIVRLRERYIRQNNQILINKNKEKLFTIIAHDLRSPLKAYQGLAEIINFQIERKEWDSIKTVSEEIDTTGKKLDLMLDNLLNWSLLEQKEIKPIKQLCNISTASHQIIELYDTIAKQKKVAINLSTSGIIVVKSDINLISLILRNLLDNAVKNATEATPISLTIGLSKNDLDIKISNFFDPEYLDTVAHLVNNIKRPEKIEGRGIGLKFIIQAVHLLNGKIDATIETKACSLDIHIIIPEM